ncbi:type I restriction endonuclease [Escherichia coli]|uniref:type I restriction endonuclease n=1 Tax=Escherichia coli TaxID=562 RepID=UPI000BE33E2E|nr:type I restriction endonuclease [Escherichia coli]EEW2156217.1 hypothetical protein [Escherichia coli]EGI4310585.1 hypothetical protein [Escherichia coli]EGU9725794.1 hypothetical protein [Escherichia coli]EHB7578926.1 hypothetical protein [Escherichia coli]
MDKHYQPKFQEEYSAKIPALTLLTSLGWTFLSPKQIMDYRGYKQDEVVLRPVLREELSKRSFMAGGKTCQLSEKALDNLISQVCSPALNEGLLKANERMYNHLLYGIAVTEFVDGKKVNPTIALIDWEHPENNQFHFTEEFTVLRSGGVETRRPDIVCFVNGIPLAVIEAKSPAGHGKKGPTIDEGISQSIRNQLNDEIPQLFAYSQILLSINGHDGRYGTCHTPMKFWAAWREEDITYAQMYALRNHKLSTEQIHALFDHRPSADLDWYQQLIAAGELAVSGQDKLLISLLSPERLLEMTRFFTLFDKKTGKIVARYQQVFGIKRLLERISTRRPDGGREGGVTREGNTEVDESKLPEVTKWWKDNVGTQDESVYTRNIISRFDTDEKLKLLIVVDKLLTGFDEPKNTVLYIDKPLKSHNLIQAIARVNRLHPLKKFGLLIDYRGILAELDTTIGKYQDLASRTQGGYDIKDIDGLYSAMSSEYKRLPHLYNQLWAIFAGVKNKNDTEQLRAVLVPKMEERDGEMVDIHQKTRDDFFEALTAFAGCLKVALQSATFFTDKSFTEQDRNLYKETVKQMSSLRQWAMQVSGEQVNYDDYAEQVKKLLDKHVTGVEVREPDGVYEVGKMGKSEKPSEWDNNKTRNETDIIKTRVTKMIEQELRDDPYAQEAFSKLLRMAIEEAEKLFDHPLKQYLLFREFEEQVEARKLSDIPDALAVNKHAQAYYGVFKKELPEVFAVNDVQVQDKWTKLAFEVDNIIVKAVAENSLNPQDIEKVVKTSLLPLLFTACREIGAGMNQVNRIVETIIQILRVGLMKS